jgi:hypothetical protein
MLKWMGITAGVVLLSAATAAAGEPGGMGFPAAKPDAPTADATSSCSCRYPGGSVELGETVCMTTSGDPYLARCEMVLNNTAWKRVKDSCAPVDAVSSLTPLDRFAQLIEPVFHPGLVHAQITAPID